MFEGHRRKEHRPRSWADQPGFELARRHRAGGALGQRRPRSDTRSRGCGAV